MLSNDIYNPGLVVLSNDIYNPGLGDHLELWDTGSTITGMDLDIEFEPVVVEPQPKWPLFGAIGAFAGVVLAIIAWNVTLPYYAMSPGPLYDVVDFISVGEDIEADIPQGELLMLTVSLQEVNGFEYVIGNLDGDIDLVGRTAIRPVGVSREEQREQNLRAMSDSKATATFVALQRLGYDVGLTGSGVLVSSVLEDTPAAEVLQMDDVIIAVEGVPVSLAPDAVAEITSNDIGDVISLTVRRGDEVVDVDVELIQHTTFEDRPMVGFMAVTFEPGFDFPIDVDIDSQNIGGPSAGLMYTLTIMELVGEEDLTKGWTIAGTGTMDSDGVVGAIGGVKQKVIAAQDAGAKYIFVPASNFEAASTVVGDDVELIAVDSIDDALDFLETLPPA